MKSIILEKDLEILRLTQENAELKAENKSLKADLVQLSAQVSKFEKAIEIFKVKKDSHNSSLPPSKEIVKSNQSLRTKSDKKRGGQIGHKGHSLKMTATPDQIVPLEPDYCNICGNDLSTVSAQLNSRRQEIEIPPIIPIYIEYQSMSKLCSCGHLQVGNFPEHITNHIQYGASVQATVAYESTRQYTPFQRLSEKMASLFNLPLSQGTIRNMLHNMAQKAKPVYNEIQKRLEKSIVVGGDESGVKVGGKNWWAWVFQNKLLTFIAIVATRGMAAVDVLFKDGFANAILVSDRWRAQLNTFAKGHQLCMAHLMRDLVYLIELEKTPWAIKVKDLLVMALALKKQLTVYNDSNIEVQQIEQTMNLLLSEELFKDKTPKTLVFQRALKKNRDYLFPFLYYDYVPPDNNGSERAVRNIKVKQKVSGQFNGGQEDFAILRSVIDTVIKNSGNVFETLKLIANCKNTTIFDVAE